ncbi:AAA family ATPase [Mycoplana dimorpha]
MIPVILVTTSSVLSSEEPAGSCIQVVNALLECLDGLEGREGVVVVGATNNSDNIDPAILRSGRLDRQIEIPLPSEQDRIAILAQHIDHCIEVTELEGLKAWTAGMSGADLAKAARDARRLARRAKRPLNLDDVRAVLPAPIDITPEHRRALAIHEVGHTVVGLALGHGIYRAQRSSEPRSRARKRSKAARPTLNCRRQVIGIGSSF